MYEVRLKSTFVRFVIAFLVVQVLLVFFFWKSKSIQKSDFCIELSLHWNKRVGVKIQVFFSEKAKIAKKRVLIMPQVSCLLFCKTNSKTKYFRLGERTTSAITNYNFSIWLLKSVIGNFRYYGHPIVDCHSFTWNFRHCHFLRVQNFQQDWESDWPRWFQRTGGGGIGNRSSFKKKDQQRKQRKL